MAGIRVVTDSACDLPQALADEHGIEIVPLTIRFGDEELVDRRDLSPKEFEILAVLAGRANHVITREELVRLVWPAERPVKRQTLDVYLFSLRSKIEDNSEHPARLLTVRGVGYRLIAPGETPLRPEPAPSSPSDSAPAADECRGEDEVVASREWKREVFRERAAVT